MKTRLKMLEAFVSGYHSVYPLNAEEVDLVWRLLRMRLAVSVVNSTLLASKNSEDGYITISQAPAWKFLENLNINEGLIKARLRNICGMPVVEGADRIMDWIKKESNNFSPLFGINLANLEIKSFNDLVDICNSKKEVELKYELETNVNLINFKNGYIEISFNENLKKDFVKILSSKLYEWTNTRWIISLSQNKGQETIKKTSEGEKKNNLKDFEQTDIFNNIKNSFPDAELIDVKDNKDD